MSVGCAEAIDQRIVCCKLQRWPAKCARFECVGDRSPLDLKLEVAPDPSRVCSHRAKQGRAEDEPCLGLPTRPTPLSP